MDTDYSLVQQIVFGNKGNDELVVPFGWSGPETDFRWTDGSACDLWLTHPGKRNLILTVEAWPLTNPPTLLHQRVHITVHGKPLGSLTFNQLARQAIYIPVGSLEEFRILRLHFTLPDAARPVDIGTADDGRQLSLAFVRVGSYAAPALDRRQLLGSGGIVETQVHARVLLSSGELLGNFEQLGETLVFDNFLASFGVRGHRLLQGTEMRLIDLIRAIDAGFEGLGDPERLQSTPIDGYKDGMLIRDLPTNFNFFVKYSRSEAGIESLIERESRRIRFLRDQLWEDIVLGEKIFIYHTPPSHGRLSNALMLPLLVALRQHGPCALLFVTPSDDKHPPGTVEQKYPGLLQGYVGGNTDPIESVRDRNEWLEVCSNAYALRLR